MFRRLSPGATALMRCATAAAAAETLEIMIPSGAAHVRVKLDRGRDANPRRGGASSSGPRLTRRLRHDQHPMRVDQRAFDGLGLDHSGGI
jgi:hypothetical protein